MAMGKALTTPADLQRGVLDGLADAAGGLGLELEALLADTGRMVHATTQSSQRGVRLLRREDRGAHHPRVRRHADHHARDRPRRGAVACSSAITTARPQKPRLLADERDIFEIAERVDHRGQVVVPLDEAAVRAAAREIRERGYQAVAVAYLFSHQNAAHERRTARDARRGGARPLRLDLRGRRAGDRRVRALRNRPLQRLRRPGRSTGYLARLERTLRRHRPEAETPHRPGERRRGDVLRRRCRSSRSSRAPRRASSAPRTSRGRSDGPT